MKKIVLKGLVPFIPLIITFIVLIFKPYYFFPVGADLPFHLVRAREVLENPFYGSFWDFLVYYPIGRAVWHPPLFHLSYASLWLIGGVRFANSFMCILQILLTVGVASWIAKKEYGIVAGFFAGIFALSAPQHDFLFMAVPAAYIPILAVLTIYFLPKDKTKAFITSIIGLWTHIIGLVTFIPLFFVDSYKDKENLKMVALLLPSFFFWVGYWIYFKDQTGVVNQFNPSFNLVYWFNFSGWLLLLIFGNIGLYFLYKINNKLFKLNLAYLLIVIMVQYFFGDISRGFQYAALPMAILSGFAIQKGYEYVSKNYRTALSAVFIVMIFICSIIGVGSFFESLMKRNVGWNDLDIPFEVKYKPLKMYIEKNTNVNDIVWAESEVADTVAWMTGRRVSNGRYGAPKGFIEKHQRINVYYTDGIFLINDINNKTLEQIKVSV